VREQICRRAVAERLLGAPVIVKAEVAIQRLEPKMSGKPASACFFQPPTWVGWTPNICAIWAAVFVRLDGLHGDFGLQAGWVTLTCSGH
jgi:hypothetical protein